MRADIQITLRNEYLQSRLLAFQIIYSYLLVWQIMEKSKQIIL